MAKVQPVIFFLLVCVFLYLLCQHLSMCISIHSLIYMAYTSVLMHRTTTNIYLLIRNTHKFLIYTLVLISLNTFMTSSTNAGTVTFDEAFLSYLGGGQNNQSNVLGKN